LEKFSQTARSKQDALCIFFEWKEDMSLGEGHIFDGRGILRCKIIGGSPNMILSEEHFDRAIFFGGGRRIGEELSLGASGNFY
jgi:hypothetical protein